MDYHQERQQKAKTIRIFRRIHRFTGIFLFVFLFIVGVTGIMLGWKKNSFGLILADTTEGSSLNPDKWLSIDSLQKKAMIYMSDSMGVRMDAEIDRIDVRPDKGVLKFTFKNHYNGLQLDAATGIVLKVERRNADMIEQIHDGSIVQKIFSMQTGIFKLLYTSIMGLGLITFTVTGFWLW
ncbi:MAG: PepSY domain-containing protein, partial [Saprospiraceae bacterium]|nr:PepSY domain-containing protein [Saprospiraceae bacterium]